MLNKRQANIITIMSESKKWITGKELAQLFNVSGRTIRSDVESINRHYQQLITSDQHRGYQLDRSLLHSLVEKEEHVIPQTAEERSSYILQTLLFQRHDLNLGNLQNQVFVSGYSIENDMKRIRKMIESYEDLKLVRSKNFIKLEGSEKNKRKLYKDLLEKEAKGNFLNMNKLASFYKEFDLLLVKEILDTTIDKYDYPIREMAMPMLMIHIGVAIERIIHHNFVSTDVKNTQLLQSKEYMIASQFFTRVSKKIRIELVEDEIVRLALLLMGKRSSEFTENNVRIEDRDLNVEHIVEALLQNIYDNFDVDVRGDVDLQIGLQMHLQSLFERQAQGIMVDNVYLQEIKKKYPLVFEMGVRSGMFINETAHVDINENEIGFIALHLGAAYERSQEPYKFRVLMIYPSDQALSKLCAKKVEQRFSQHLEIVANMSVYEEQAVKDINPDLILTTLPLVHNLDIMTEKISLFINYDDESRIFLAIHELDKIRSRLDFQEMIEDMIHPEFFYPDFEVDTPEEMIRFMCDALEEQKYITKEFRESVSQREEMSMTSFVFGFAIPHALNVPALRSCLSIAILKHPIRWGEFDIQLVILIGIKENDKKLMGIFFDWLSNVVSNPTQFALLLQAKTHQEFISQILEN